MQLGEPIALTLVALCVSLKVIFVRVSAILLRIKFIVILLIRRVRRVLNFTLAGAHNWLVNWLVGRGRRLFTGLLHRLIGDTLRVQLSVMLSCGPVTAMFLIL